MEMQKNGELHELAIMPIHKLLIKFSVPCIISLLVSAFYNIVDQIFIGQGVGYYGNAATSVAFPLMVIANALALMIGDGGAAFFSLKTGEKDFKVTESIIGNVVTLLTLVGVGLAVFSMVFLKQILIIFGATEGVLPYALDYTSIIVLGFPFAVFSTGFNSIIRADGTPKYAMLSMLLGALLNTILDPVFIFGFGMGVKGAAIATIIGQISSTILAILYLRRLKNIKFKIAQLKLKFSICSRLIGFGISSLITQLSIAIVAISTNNILTHYGATSIYGSEIPLSVFGIVTKVNQIMLSLLLGIAVGSQPILGFNYGAKQMDRIKQTIKITYIGAISVTLIGLVFFQFFPQQIIQLFGAGDALYNEFAVLYFRIFLSCCTLSAVQIVSTIFFQATGHPLQAGILSVSRQVLFYLPPLFILPMFFGVKGAIYAGPVADISAFILTVILMMIQWKKMNQIEVATQKQIKTEQETCQHKLVKNL